MLKRPFIVFRIPMATQTCWRCTSRILSNPIRPQVSQNTVVASAAFSTTAHLSAANPVKKGGAAAPSRGRRTLRLAKSKRESKGRPPEPGERKALRKRIVLSNTNAFEVTGLKDLGEQNYADKELVGSIVGIAGDLIDPLRAVEAFKATQGWSFFRRPTTLYREETLQLANHIRDTAAAEKKPTVRKMIIGERVSGKSVLLLQAQAMAFLKNWVVIHIPEAQDLVNAHTAYAPDPEANPPKYIQKTYTASLLSRIAKANEPLLSSLSLSLDHTLPIPIQSNMSLTRLAETGAKDADLAWPIFLALWRELTTPATAEHPRPPMLLSLDGLPHVCRLSEYLAPNMHYIHSHDLHLVQHFMRYLSGASTLPNGGLVLAADSNSNRPFSPALDLAVRQSEERAQSPAGTKAQPLYDPEKPFDRIDERVLTTLREVDVLRVKGLSREDAKAVLEYYARSGMLRQTVTERLVAEKWTLAGGGVVGELEKGSVRIGL